MASCKSTQKYESKSSLMSIIALSSSVSRLPVEVLDKIMDNLKSSKKDLTSCSLVCHQWKASGQKPLVKRLLVQGEQDFFTIIFELVEPEPAANVKIRPILHIIEELTVYGISEDGEGSPMPVNLHHIRDLLFKLPNLKSLQIIETHIFLPHGFTAIPFTISHCEFKLQELKLSKVRYLGGSPPRLSPGWMSYFVNLFDTIDHLEVTCGDKGEEMEAEKEELVAEEDGWSRRIDLNAQGMTTIRSCKAIGGLASRLLIDTIAELKISDSDELEKIELDYEGGNEVECLGELLEDSYLSAKEIVVDMRKLNCRFKNRFNRVKKADLLYSLILYDV